MQFRPCIDIHNGKVKQIVGSSLRDQGDEARDNFVSEKGAAYYAGLYREKNIKGAHVIILNGKDSEYYKDSETEAKKALAAYPGGLLIGGGINDENAEDFVKAGADAVIVTSFVFKDGKMNRDNLKRLIDIAGKERLVLDLSCRKKDDSYYVVTDRWQIFSEEKLTVNFLNSLTDKCREFIIHSADVEGKRAGVDREVVSIISDYLNQSGMTNPITYAGGIRNYDDIELLEKESHGKIDFTVGSALDIFGGDLSFEELAAKYAG